MNQNKILIYSRDRVALERIQSHLYSPDNLIITAMSPAEVQSLLQSENLDTIVLMSQGDLYTILDLLQSIRQLPYPPVCVVAGIDSDRETILHALNAGCTYFLDYTRGIGRIKGIIGSLLDERRGMERNREKNEIDCFISNAQNKQGRSALSRRENEILYHLLQGKSNKEISRELCISEKTVKNHLWKVYRKFGVENRTQLFHQLLLSCPCINFRTVEV